MLLLWNTMIIVWDGGLILEEVLLSRPHKTLTNTLEYLRAVLLLLRAITQ